MFDRVSIRSDGGGTHHHHHHHQHEVHEHKAPTDESIKLWGDLQEKMLNSILERFSIQDNKFNIAGCVSLDPYAMAKKSLFYTLTLNGHAINGKFELDDFKYRTTNDMIQGLINHIGERIAVEVLQALFHEDKGILREIYRK